MTYSITETLTGKQLSTGATTAIDAAKFLEFSHGITIERPSSINAPYRITDHVSGSITGWYDLIECNGEWVFIEDAD